MQVVQRCRLWVSLALSLLFFSACSSTQSVSDTSQFNFSDEMYLYETFVPDRVIHHSPSDDAFILSGYVPSSMSKGEIRDAMGIGFMYPEERDIHPLERSQNMEIVVQGRTFSIDLLLSGTSGRVFLVTALLDYEQVPFRLDGKEGLIHQITLPEEMDFSRDLVLPLEVDIPTDGIHDFIVIAFDTTILAQPNADTLMSRFAAIGRRTRLLVGDATSTPALPLPIRAQPIQNEEEVWAIDDLWLSRAECGLGYRQRHPLSMGCQLYWDEDPKERRYPFTIWVGDNYRTVNEPGERRGIVLFHNYHLVPFGGNRFVTLVDVPQGHELVLPMHVELHDGVNIIQAFEIYEPYTSFLENTDSFVYKTTFPAAIIWK